MKHSLILLVLTLALSACFTPPSPLDVTKEYVQHGKVSAMHWHPHLTITVDGKNVVVPKDIGVESHSSDTEKMRILHTHDDSGKIHVESPRRQDFTLGEFFRVWGKRFEDPFGDGKAYGIRVTVDGEEITEPLPHVLRDREEIRIEYRSL